MVSKRIAVAQIGARRHYAIPAMLEREGMLESLYTDVWCGAGPLPVISRVWPRNLRPKGLRKLLARVVPGVPREKIRWFPSLAVRRVLGRKVDAQNPYPGWLRANREFCERVVRRGFGAADTVYVFNGAGLEILQQAKELGLRTVIEQTDAPVEVEESLLIEERDRWPQWEAEKLTRRDWLPMVERERQEWDLADVILCGSEYVRRGVREAGGPVDLCRVVPYGVNAGTTGTVRAQRGGPLRALFVGTLCLRKGVPYLMEAAKALGQTVDVRVVGPSRLGDSALSRLGKAVQVYGSVPRSEIGSHYEWADVLVLPTISEGSANVCYEALAAGLPVVTTPNAGSVVRDGVEGYVIPIRNWEALAERLGRLADDRSLLREMSERALMRAGEFTWERYQKRLRGALAPELKETACRVPTGACAG